MSRRRLLTDSGASPCEKTICPSPEELGVITNNVKCERCGLVFANVSRYRLHDLKVHQRKRLDKIAKENVRYHCPVQSCVYAVNSQRYFSSMKYLKQHYLKVHAEKNYACDRCGRSFSTESTKEGHTRVCGIEFKCSCSKTYTTYEALLTHAKRSSHTITERYKNPLKHGSSKTIQIVLPSRIASKPVAILPSPDKSERNGGNICTTGKSTCDVGVQTDDYKRSRRIPSPSKLNNNNNNNNSHCNAKRRICKQTQTNGLTKEKNSGKSTETQVTSQKASQANRESSRIMHNLGKKSRRASSKQSEHVLLKEDLNLGDNFASANLFSPLCHDVGLQDFWEKNTPGRQTKPKDMDIEAFNDNVTHTKYEKLYEHSHNPLIQGVSKSNVAPMTSPYVEDASTGIEGYPFASAEGISQTDPMLNAKTFDDRFSSIETQTEQAFPPSYFYSESLSRPFSLSSIETQTTISNLVNMDEQLFYSNMYTQTCNSEMPSNLSSDLELSNIET